MAKYQINYSCGHGSFEKNLYGKHSERDNYVEWAEQNMVCPDCYKAAKKEEDSKAEKIAKICLVPNLDPTISIEVTGQIEANKDDLYKFGYHWCDSNNNGLLGYFSTKKPQRVLALTSRIESVEQIGEWITEQQNNLEKLGYKLLNGLNDLDIIWIKDNLAKKQEKKENLKNIQEKDPKPEISPLRKRIAAIEKESGSKWNGKIYGRKDSYNFYVANVKYNATNFEVEERETINKAIDQWNEKYKNELSNT